MRKTSNKPLISAKRPNFAITPELHAQVRNYCKANGLKIHFWTQKVLTEALARENQTTVNTNES